MDVRARFFVLLCLIGLTCAEPVKFIDCGKLDFTHVKDFQFVLLQTAFNFAPTNVISKGPVINSYVRFLFLNYFIFGGGILRNITPSRMII